MKRNGTRLVLMKQICSLLYTNEKVIKIMSCQRFIESMIQNESARTEMIYYLNIAIRNSKEALDIYERASRSGKDRLMDLLMKRLLKDVERLTEWKIVLQEKSAENFTQ